MRIDKSGNVGIGASTPATNLEDGSGTAARAFIRANRTGGLSYGLELSNRATEANGVGTGIRFMGAANWLGGIDAAFDNASAGDASLRFKTAAGGGISERMRIDKSGNVGIGTVAPSAKLHVAGNVIVDGNIGAKYQDVAEWVEASEDLRPGTVVIADADNANSVRASNTAYDTAVAGVISARPGILLGEKGVGKVAVAQSGRVKVKVDASYGAITPGDLLVTSATEGYARRSDPLDVAGVPLHRPGTILGKALEPLTTGRGEVLTLLTLQ